MLETGDKSLKAFQKLKIKDIAELVGRFQVRPKSKLIMLLRKNSTFLFLNKSSLIVFILKKKKTDVMVAGQLTYMTILLTLMDAQVINSTPTYLE